MRPYVVPAPPAGPVLPCGTAVVIGVPHGPDEHVSPAGWIIERTASGSRVRRIMVGTERFPLHFLIEARA